MSYSIAIDGPAGAGKSTIARKIAAQKGYIYVDTGAMYRAMALFLLEEGVRADQPELISGKCREADISIRYEDNMQVVYLNGRNVNGLIRTEEVGNMASASSVNGDVRRKLVELQQKLAETTDVVMDGRDIGTCVLPHANLKIYLTASVEVRAKRRYDELTARGEICDLDKIAADIRERDTRDMTREISPLRQAQDAVLIDSSDLGIDEVVAKIISLSQQTPQKPEKRNVEIRLATSAGFCFGVKRAVETVYEQIREQEKQFAATGKRLPIYTYGPIIHNEQVVQDLEKKGVQVLQTEEELEGLQEGIVIIRSHGVSKEIYDRLAAKNLICVDATCPFVKRIHDIVSEASESGSNILIVGNAGHPEVEGIMGWCKHGATVVESEEEMEKLSLPEAVPVCVVSQTTFNYNKFQELVEILKKKRYNVTVVNTICNATEERQTEAREIAAEADVMIVIGGAHSSNTRKLYEICSKECAKTYFVQTLDDLHLELPKSVRLVGITAGASTPNNIIEEVQSYVRRNF